MPRRRRRSRPSRSPLGQAQSRQQPASQQPLSAQLHTQRVRDWLALAPNRKRRRVGQFRRQGLATVQHPAALGQYRQLVRPKPVGNGHRLPELSPADAKPNRRPPSGVGTHIVSDLRNSWTHSHFDTSRSTWSTWSTRSTLVNPVNLVSFSVNLVNPKTAQACSWAAARTGRLVGTSGADRGRGGLPPSQPSQLCRSGESTESTKSDPGSQPSQRRGPGARGHARALSWRTRFEPSLPGHAPAPTEVCFHVRATATSAEVSRLGPAPLA